MNVSVEIPNAEKYKLCFVDGRRAYFTDADNMGALVTDDWDDGRDEAILYGVDEPYELVTLMFDGPLDMKNYEAAPEDILHAEMEWIASTTWAENPVSIPALTPLSQFVNDVELAGGNLWIQNVGGGVTTDA